KFFILVISLVLSSSVFSETRCPRGDYKSLVETWKIFQQVSLDGDQQKIVHFYKFPLKLYGPYDGQKPIRLSKKTFLQNYHSIFEQVVEGTDTKLRIDLNERMSAKYVQVGEFGREGFLRGTEIFTLVAGYFFV
ncbi:MAG: hypothetical protein NTY70_00180, partial [Burkholderiales bacterium]|nr:hypothetical protein [Burkholderiales bacterium]